MPSRAASLVSQKIVSDHQFGFLPGRSTTTQLVYVFDQWSSTLEQQNSTAVIFMDFMKAFHKVWHQGLIYKLAQMGVGRSALNWLRNYLSNRSISVRVRSSSSAFASNAMTRTRTIICFSVREPGAALSPLLWSVKACPADHRGWFLVFALPLIVTPPNLQNHLALASEGYLNNQCFGSSSRNVGVGGEGREKHNPEMSVCNGDSTSSRCRRLKRRAQYSVLSEYHMNKSAAASVDGTFQLFVLAKNLLSRPPLKKMGPVFDPAKTTARTD